MTDLLEAISVTYRIGDAVLLANVDLSLHPGEFVVVIGPNGAGKSTLLNALAGDLFVTGGEVRLNGEAIDRFDAAELARIRAVYSEPASHAIQFTVAEVVAMGNHPARGGRTGDVSRVMVAMDLDHLAGRAVATLSGGERARVSIARMLAQNTEIMLLDEPLRALDIAHQERVLRTLAALADDGRGVISVVHDLTAAAAYADRIVVLHEGRVLAEGEPTAVLEEGLLTDVYGLDVHVSTIHGRVVVVPQRV